MHESVKAYVKELVEKHGLATLNTLEIGSRNINGSPREFFSGPYYGIDMIAGPGVDEVINAHDLFWKDKYEVILCCEVLEHDDAFWITMKNIGHLLAPGGHLILTTRGIGFPFHEYPGDYWRFTKDAGTLLAKLAGLESHEVIDDPQASGIFLYGRKAT